MTTASHRADNYVVGYDMGSEGGTYTAISIGQVREDGTLEMLASKSKPSSEFGRLEILEFIVDFIKERQPPLTLAIHSVGGNIAISKETVDEIIAGRVTARDLLIGS